VGIDVLQPVAGHIQGGQSGQTANAVWQHRQAGRVYTQQLQRVTETNLVYRLLDKSSTKPALTKGGKMCGEPSCPQSPSPATKEGFLQRQDI
jgi:hypothetical protein